MKKFVLTAVAFGALAFVGLGVQSAEARGCFRGRSYYRAPVHTSWYGGGYGGGIWHDTSHFDYHPGGYVPHGNHFDYVPGHLDLHRTGHWHW